MPMRTGSYRRFRRFADDIGKYIHPLEHGQLESMRMNLLKPQDKK